MRIAGIVAGVLLAGFLAACGAEDVAEPADPGVPTEPPEERDPPEQGEPPDEQDPPEGAAPPSEADPPGEADPPDDEDPMGDEDQTQGRVAPGLGGLVDSAVADLAERLDVAPEEISVLSAESVVWSDPSLGCPHPDMRYRQIPQDGTRIELEHDGRTYDYHSGGDRPEPFLCEQPHHGSSPPGGDFDI